MEDYPPHMGAADTTIPTSRGGFMYPSSSSSPGGSIYGRNSNTQVSAMQQRHIPDNSTSATSSNKHIPLNPFQLISEAAFQPPVKTEGGSSYGHQQRQFNYAFSARAGGEGSHSSGDMDAIKAKIISHPQYSSLLEAYMDCQKVASIFEILYNGGSPCLPYIESPKSHADSQVGSPPEVAARLAAVAREFESRRRAALGCRDPPSDPELDQFMVLILQWRELT